ncbi:MAG: hypothetical protein ACE5DI_06515 [Candidatus Micrarchaeia archaeon]
MVFVFGIDFPVMEVLVLIDLILFVYAMLLFYQLLKLKSVTEKLSNIVGNYIHSDIVLWSADRLKSKVKVDDLKSRLLKAGYSNADDIISKASALNKA